MITLKIPVIINRLLPGPVHQFSQTAVTIGRRGMGSVVIGVIARDGVMIAGAQPAFRGVIGLRHLFVFYPAPPVIAAVSHPERNQTISPNANRNASRRLPPEMPLPVGKNEVEHDGRDLSKCFTDLGNISGLHQLIKTKRRRHVLKGRPAHGNDLATIEPFQYPGNNRSPFRQANGNFFLLKTACAF